VGLADASFSLDGYDLYLPLLDGLVTGFEHTNVSFSPNERQMGERGGWSIMLHRGGARPMLSARKVLGRSHCVWLFEQAQVAGFLLKELAEPLDIVRARKSFAGLPAGNHQVIGSANALGDHFLRPSPFKASPAQELIGGGLRGLLDHGCVLSKWSTEYSYLPRDSSPCAWHPQGPIHPQPSLYEVVTS
jgi:hypothetical protein